MSLSTVLEVYRVLDMAIARVLPSADDEINTALFHPFMVRCQLLPDFSSYKDWSKTDSYHCLLTKTSSFVLHTIVSPESRGEVRAPSRGLLVCWGKKAQM